MMRMMMMMRRMASRSYGSRSGGRDFASRSYSSQSGRRDFSRTSSSIVSGRGGFVVACSKALFTGSALAAGYASGPYVRAFENEDLKEDIQEMEINLFAIEQLLKIAQTNLALLEIIEEAEQDRDIIA